METIKKEFISNINKDNGYTNKSVGTHKSTMELFFTKDGKPMCIEWIIESLDEVEHIGLEVEGKNIVGYDGVFEIPDQAIEMLESLGYDCSEIK